MAGPQDIEIEIWAGLQAVSSSMQNAQQKASRKLENTSLGAGTGSICPQKRSSCTRILSFPPGIGIERTIGVTRKKDLTMICKKFLVVVFVVSPFFSVDGTNSQEPVRIMPLGDSITAGHLCIERGGYRSRLWAGLEEAGWTIDFVGANNDQLSDMPDRDNQGMYGWHIETMLPEYAGWLTTEQPDIVLLMIGTNDISLTPDVNEEIAELEQLVDGILQHDCAPTLYLASTPLISGRDSEATAYNAASERLVAARRESGYNIYYVDVYSTMDWNDMADGKHPNCEGYGKIAAAYLAALLEHEDVTLTRRGSVSSMSGRKESSFTASLSVSPLGREATTREALAAGAVIRSGLAGDAKLTITGARQKHTQYP